MTRRRVAAAMLVVNRSEVPKEVLLVGAGQSLQREKRVLSKEVRTKGANLAW